MPEISQSFMAGAGLGAQMQSQAASARLALRGQLLQEEGMRLREREATLSERRAALAESEHNRLMQQLDLNTRKIQADLDRAETMDPLLRAEASARLQIAQDEAAQRVTATTYLGSFQAMLDEDYMEEVKALQLGQPRPGRTRSSEWLSADPNRAKLFQVPAYRQAVEKYEELLGDFMRYGLTPQQKMSQTITALEQQAAVAPTPEERDALLKQAEGLRTLTTRGTRAGGEPMQVKNIGGTWYGHTGQTWQALKPPSAVRIAEDALKVERAKAFPDPAEVNRLVGELDAATTKWNHDLQSLQAPSAPTGAPGGGLTEDFESWLQSRP